MVAGTRRLKNLSEILSPTVQSGGANGGDDDNPAGASGGRYNGSYHCKAYKEKNRCDVCSYSEETSFVTSYYFQRRFAIHGRNIHLPASQKKKMTWFVYLIHDTACQLLYVGSTTDVCSRWSGTKTCLLYTSPSPRDGLLSRMPSSA